MILNRRIGALALVAGFAFARGVWAQPLPATEPGAVSGSEAASAPSSSIEELQRRFLQSNDPEVGLSLARALVEKRRWLEAEAFYREVSAIELLPDSPPSASAAKALASTERDALLRRMPAVVITVESATPNAVQVFVNDARVPASELGSRQLVDPGTVRIVGLLPGSRLETLVEVAERETRSVRLALEAKVAPAPLAAPVSAATRVQESSNGNGRSIGRVVGFVAMGVGGAAVITGGVFGVLALRDEASLEGRCPNDTCPGKLQPEVDAYESKKSIATVGLIGGALLGLGGAALYLFSAPTEPSGARGARAGVFWAGQHAGVWGTF